MSDDLVSRLQRLARIARRALETNKRMSIWCADPDTLDAAATALTEARAEIERLRAGINGIVNCQGPMTRAQVREACAEILDNKTVGLDNQSPFAAALGDWRVRATTMEISVKEAARSIHKLMTRAVAAESALSTLRARVREVVGPFAAGSIDISGAAVIIGYPQAEPAHRAARQLMEEVK